VSVRFFIWHSAEARDLLGEQHLLEDQAVVHRTFKAINIAVRVLRSGQVMTLLFFSAV
jgi:hypothetical protein